jgi:hypothetical protein
VLLSSLRTMASIRDCFAVAKSAGACANVDNANATSRMPAAPCVKKNADQKT